MRPSFRPTPAGLGSFFQRHLRQMEEDFAVSARVTPKADNELAS